MSQEKDAEAPSRLLCDLVHRIEALERELAAARTYIRELEREIKAANVGSFW